MEEEKRPLTERDKKILNEVRSVHKDGEYSHYHDYISMQELKAINKKCEELGWI